jgi:glycosyltransferase involved in cell wall biosynthesis
MRVLHLPTNTASIPSHTVRGLSEIGVDAQGVVIGNPMIHSAEGLKVIEVRGAQWTPPWIWGQLVKSFQFVKWATWADVIHWYFDASMLPLGMDLKIIGFLGKPAVVEWLGSDIRIPEVEFADNPYYKSDFNKGYEHQSENLQKSRRTQQAFTKQGFLPVLIPCMTQYIQKDICPRFYKIGQRIMLRDFAPRYPDPNKKKPLVVHAPSAPVAKGTAFVLKAVEQLKEKYEFEFVLIQGLPRKKALDIIGEADIFLDQFIIGYYGMAALEAMAYGKPVLCYVKPSVLREEPSFLPIVNANPDTLVEMLGLLLRDGGLRLAMGEQGRAYVEKYHDAVKLAYQLLEIYQEVIRGRRS